jgi:hypothetical protein
MIDEKKLIEWLEERFQEASDNGEIGEEWAYRQTLDTIREGELEDR